jgi:hypothetical protein
MGMNLPPEQLEVYKRIDEILWHEWDPIGVTGIEQARDDYYGYLPEVLQMLLEGATSSQIAAYLQQVTTQNIGLDSSLEDHVAVAEKIHNSNKLLTI